MATDRGTPETPFKRLTAGHARLKTHTACHMAALTWGGVAQLVRAAES